MRRGIPLTQRKKLIPWKPKSKRPIRPGPKRPVPTPTKRTQPRPVPKKPTPGPRKPVRPIRPGPKRPIPIGKSKKPISPKRCSADVRRCPDGSYVGRDSANNCAFRTCPRRKIKMKSGAKLRKGIRKSL